MDDQTLHHFMEDISPIIIGVVLIITSGWVIGTVVRAFRDKANWRTRADLYTRLLDKFGSSTEFVDYLQTETGRQFFEELPVQQTSPMSKILSSIQRGVILLLLGLGLVFLGNLYDNSLGGDLYIILVVSGTVALMVGTGFLISTGISYYLSKRWGLLKVEENPAKDKRETEKRSAEV